MQLQVGSALTDITVPPTDGYSTESIPIIANRLYLIRLGTSSFNYAKIFVRSVNSTQVVVDAAVQTSSDILSY